MRRSIRKFHHCTRIVYRFHNSGLQVIQIFHPKKRLYPTGEAQGEAQGEDQVPLWVQVQVLVQVQVQVQVQVLGTGTTQLPEGRSNFRCDCRSRQGYGIQRAFR